MKASLSLLHGAGDYVLGILLICAPWLCGFSASPIALWTTVGFGIAMIGYSLLTDYETAAVRRIPMMPHLALDAVLGGLLIGAPWMLGFADVTWVPHLVLGSIIAGRALIVAALWSLPMIVDNFRATPGRTAHR